MQKIYTFLTGLMIVAGGSNFTTSLADACTRIFWNTNPGLMIVARNEDYVTA